MTGFLERLAPRFALSRELARVKLGVLQQSRAALTSNYEPTGGGPRSSEFKYNNQDAYVAARRDRAPLSFIARDMLRNNSRVVRANNLIANYTVGGGVTPVVEMVSGEDKKNKDKITGLINEHLMTSAIDVDGLHNLPALQALAMSSIPVSGEVLQRVRWRDSKDPLPLPFQIQLLEPDFLNTTIVGRRGAGSVQDGIEYDAIGRRVAYHLFKDHPGGFFPSQTSVPVAAENMAHAFLASRPGQQRGVSWYAPVMTELLDLNKLMGAVVKQAEMAALFAGILNTDEQGKFADSLLEVQSGSIVEMGQGEDLTFNSPPQFNGPRDVIRVMDQAIAAGLMIPVEALTSDYTGLNYSGGRMARMDTDPTVTRWQKHVLINQLMVPLGGWFKKGVLLKTGIDPDSYRLNWTPPTRAVVDPTKDYPAYSNLVDAGFSSRRAVIRKLGEDPDVVEAQIAEELKWEEDNRIKFSSRSGMPQGLPADEPTKQGGKK